MSARTILWVLVGLLVCTQVFAQEIVRLSVRERADAERIKEPITNGFPLPRGLVKDVGELALRSADGKDLPAQFTALNRWPKDNSLRWVLLDTQLDVGPGRAEEVIVVKGEVRVPKTELQVTETSDQITVVTGPLKFSVRKRGFRLFEEAWLDPSGRQQFGPGHKILKAPERGISMLVLATEYTSALDAESEVEIEEAGPLRVALKASGRLTSKEGKKGFQYILRIHAYAGLAEVKVVCTVVNVEGKRTDAPPVSDLSLEVATTFEKRLRYSLGSDDSIYGFNLVKGYNAYVHVDTSDSFQVVGPKEKEKGWGKCKSVKPLTLGWGDLNQAEKRGVAVGVRRFWENYPKAIELKGDGRVIAHLYPSFQQEPVRVFTGMAKTHEALVLFHGKAAPEAIEERFVAFQRPLYAFAPTSWYCRQTRALGNIAESEPKLFGDYADQIARYEKIISDTLTELVRVQDKWTKRGITMDAYGWLAYGDTLHWVWEPGKTGDPWNIAWDANYYDMPHLVLHHFARTGEPRWFDFFVDHSCHLMDIDTVHYDPGFPGGGASRRCPATNHVGYDFPDHDYAIINVAFDHHKSESLFERYYMLGDRRSLTVAHSLLQHAYSYKDADYGGTRRPGHQILTLVAGYQCTHDKKYLERAWKIIQTGLERQKQYDGGFNPRPNFTDGILLEGFANYYFATGDERVYQAIKKGVDFLLARNYKFPNAAHAHALVWSKTGDEKYLESALANLRSSGVGHLGKDLASHYRNSAYVTGYLAEKLK